MFRGAFPDTAVVDRATAAFDAMIAEQKAAAAAAGDHFAKPGANDRVWNALEKLAVRDPEAFVDYYANDIIALVSRGLARPGLQVTSQVNVVRPGGQAQDPHRDYHLGFLTNDVAGAVPGARAPALAGADAAGRGRPLDMPVESGPTMYLPHSQQYAPGYLAWRCPSSARTSRQHYVQLPLAKGDAAFFNPALFHGAGTNRSADIQRMANLLQVSSAFGRAMETVDRSAVVERRLPGAAAPARRPAPPSRTLRNVVAAAAEGYPFPTNLDLDQPVGGLTPETQAELVWRALQEDWDKQTFTTELAAQTERRRSSLAQVTAWSI